MIQTSRIVSGCDERAFTFVEVILVVLIIGVMAAVAMRSSMQLLGSAKVEHSRKEMDALAEAIVGSSHFQSGGIRSDFGYVGDIGALPASLASLVTNPGYATWNGPYISNDIAQVADDYTRDGWGVLYAYSKDSLFIRSTGSGSDIVRVIAQSTDGLLANRLAGNVFDMDGTPPGMIYRDSITVSLVIPNGTGGTVTKTSIPTAGGYFSIDSIPIGVHRLTIVYAPSADSVFRDIAVEPESEVSISVNLSGNYWFGSFAGLVGYWPFDETSGTTAVDASDNGRDGALTNMSSPGCWVAGHDGNGLSFDGSSDYVSIAHDAAFDLGSSYSLTGWFNMAAADKADYRTILCKETNSTDRNWWLCIRADGSLYWRLTSGGIAHTVTTIGNYADNSWHSFAAVKLGSSMKLFVDGIIVGSTVGASNADTQPQPIIIGSQNGANCFKGRLDEIRVYSKALNASEISAMAM